MVRSPAPTPRARGLAWSSSRALLGLCIGLPAAVVVLFEQQAGLALAVGVIPAASMAPRPLRRARWFTVVVSTMAACSMVLGAALAQEPALAVIGVFALSVGTALWATRGRPGMLAMSLGLPLVGIGLSFTDVGEAALLGSLMVLGSVWAYLVSLFWPEGTPTPGTAPRLPVPVALGYGCLLGAAGGTAAAIGFAADLEHVGWPVAAALLVMRPGRDALVLRSLGRAGSVVVGATLSGVFMTGQPSTTAIAAAVLAALVGLSATQPSRWYVTPGFTTFIVFVLLLQDDPGEAGHRFGERTLETLLGVGLALLFGAAVPAILHRLRRGKPTATSSREPSGVSGTRDDTATRDAAP